MEKQIKKVADSQLQTAFGLFQLFVFVSKDGKEHVALVKGEKIHKEESVLVRVHSECMTGDVFFSQRCDCGPQLKKALQKIEKAKKGILIYLRQEGRGIGLVNKIKAYKLQEKGFDTVDANTKLGLEVDSRKYEIAAQILRELKVKKIQLLTNNPCKIAEIEAAGIKIIKRVPLEMIPNKTNKNYLKTKKKRFSHLLKHV